MKQHPATPEKTISLDTGIGDLAWFIRTSDSETYRPLSEIVEKLEANWAEAREADKALGQILKQPGVSA